MKRVLLLTTLILGLCTAGTVHFQLAERLADLPNNETIQVIVHMKEQPDLSIMQNAQKQTKLQFLQEFCLANQEDLLDYLYSLGNKVADLRSWWIFNGLSFSSTQDIIERVAARADVDYIIDDFIISLDPEPDGDKLLGDSRGAEWNIAKVCADQCWDEGYDGTGIVVGNIDSGVNVDLPCFGGRWVPGGWYDAVNDSTYPYDDAGHGTRCMGILCGGDGDGPYEFDIGVAPGANFICAKAMDSTVSGYASWYHNCLQWFATQYVHVISNSWCFSRVFLAYFWDDCMNLRNLGVVLVFALGNEGPTPMTDMSPGNYPTVIGVGATSQLDHISPFSSRGPAPDQSPWNDTTYWSRPDWNLIKPDISAPGTAIRVPNPDGTWKCGNGTSFACPHVAGAAAICLQKDSTLSYEELYNILLDYADRPECGEPYPNNDFGWGRLNVYSALQAITLGDQPNLVLRNADVTTDNNNNGKLDPGEDAGIVCLIKNAGTQPATNIQAILKTTSQEIVITDSLYNYPALNAGDSATNTIDPFDVQVSPGALIGTIVSFDLQLVCAESTWTRTFSKQIGTASGEVVWGPKHLGDMPSSAFIEGVTFDPIGDQLFILSYTSRTIYRYSSDSSATYLGSLTGPDTLLTDIAYSDYDDNLWVTSNNMKQIWKIDKSGNILRSFANPANDFPMGLAYHNNILWCADYRSAPADTKYIYISDTLGNAVQYLNPIQGFQNPRCMTYDSCGNAFIEVHTWYDSSSSYLDSVGAVEYQGTPPTTTGNKLMLPFGWEVRGIAFDPRDGNYWVTIPKVGPTYTRYLMKVKGFHEPSLGIQEYNKPEIASGYQLYASPNPAISNLICQFSLPTKGKVKLAVYDALGRLVYTLIDDTPCDANSHAINWDLKDSQKRKIANGVYFLCLETTNAHVSNKITVLR